MTVKISQDIVNFDNFDEQLWTKYSEYIGPIIEFNLLAELTGKTEALEILHFRDWLKAVSAGEVNDKQTIT